MVAVQIVCFGVAALGSLGLSMDDELPVNTVLRCRYNANALQRSADRARDRMEKRQARELQAEVPPKPQPLDESAVLESMRSATQAQHRAAEAWARLTGEPVPEQPLMQELREGTAGPETFDPSVAAATTVDAPPPAVAATAVAAPPGQAAPGQAPHPTTAAGRRDMEGKVIWAGAMAKVATELAEELPHLPPHEQRLHQIRINALCSVSQELAAGRGKTRAAGVSAAALRRAPAERTPPAPTERLTSQSLTRSPCLIRSAAHSMDTACCREGSR